jgi:squalene-hopene/tetraprenyl-beta-curcumene cyclase
MLADVKKRVSMWSEVEPFYQDSPERAMGARNSEAVLNALILASYDARGKGLTETTKKAFEEAWALQLTTGKDAGSWVWLNFHNAPWEGEESPYQGAAFAALAAGLAGNEFMQDAKNKPRLELLRGYLLREYLEQPLANKTMLLWASTRLPGLMSRSQMEALTRELFALQQTDGGWSLSSLGSWTRRDGTPQEAKSDGYATGLVLLAMKGNGSEDKRLGRAAEWLRQNQDHASGAWTAYSLNKKRDPDSDAGKFMSDAATAYAALGLEAYEASR